MRFGLREKTIKQIQSVFRKYPEISQVKIYGSRARGDYKKGSDIDLVFISESKTDLSSKLLWELDELPTLYLFDVTAYHLLNDGYLKQEIDKYGKEFYTSDTSDIAEQSVIPALSGNPESKREGKSLSSRPLKSGIQSKLRSPRRASHPLKAGIQKEKDQLLGLTQRHTDTQKTEHTEIGKIPKDSALLSSSIVHAPVGIQPEAESSTKNFSPLKTENHNHLFFETISESFNLWPIVRLEDVCTFEYGKPLKKEDRKSGPYPVFGSNGIVGYHNKYLVKGPCIIVGRKGSAGEVTYSAGNCFPIDTTFFVQLKHTSQYNLSFFYFIMCILDLKNLKTQSNVPGLNRNEAYKLQIPYPPLEEQKKIAGVLSQIQQAVSAQDRFISATKELKQATMKHLFTYGIKGIETHPVDLSEYVNPAKLVISSGPVIPAKAVIPALSGNPEPKQANKALSFRPLKTEIQKNPLSKSDQLLGLSQRHTDTQKTKHTEIGEIPEGWAIRSIIDVGKVVTGTTPKTSNKNYYGNEYKLISPADLDSGQYVTTAHRMLSQEGLSQCKVLPKETVLVGCIGNIGKIGMTIDEQSASNQQINAIICNHKTDPYFIFYLLDYSRERLKLFSAQTTVPILKKTNFEQFKIPLPPLEEQKEIADILQTIDEKAEVHKKKKIMLEELFKTMLNQLMTGKVRVHKLDINTDLLRHTDIGVTV